MVMRKQTTARPAKMPMKTARMRKKRSSSKDNCAAMRRRKDVSGKTVVVVVGTLTFHPWNEIRPRQGGQSPGECAGRRTQTVIAFRPRWRTRRATRVDRHGWQESERWPEASSVLLVPQVVSMTLALDWSQRRIFHRYPDASS